jgi:hypothetical protein
MSMIGIFKLTGDEQVDALLKSPDSIIALLEEDAGSPDDLDVDKAWHGIHFLLCGQAWESPFPLGFILGGEEVGDVDVGYGPARVF